MKLWIDDVRSAPEGYVWCKSVNEAINVIFWCDEFVYMAQKQMREPTTLNPIELIDIDHDADDYAYDGGDYIKLLDWLEETGRNYPIRIHSMNSVGVDNMRRIIKRNGWKEVFSHQNTSFQPFFWIITFILATPTGFIE